MIGHEVLPKGKEVRSSAEIEVVVAETDEEIAEAQKKIEETLYIPLDRVFSKESDAQENVLYFIAKKGDEIIGAARLRLNPGWEELEKFGLLEKMREKDSSIKKENIIQRTFVMCGIVVDEKFRRKGAGEMLYKAREDFALVARKDIGVTQARKGSRGIYKRHGYVECGRADIQVENGEDIERWLMYKLYEPL